MTRKELSDLIERAEQVVSAVDKWGGVDGISNRIDIVDEFLKKMDARKEVLIQMDKMANNLYLFKAFLTVDEAASYLDIHRSTVYKLIKTQGLTTFSPPSTKMLILTEDLVAWCKQYPNEVPEAESSSGTQKKKVTKK